LTKPKTESITSTQPQSEVWGISYNEIVFGRLIGRGSYGEVWKSLWRNTPCAVKSLYTEDMNPKTMKNLKAEIDLLCKLRHPNVVLFMGACLDESTPCIVMEYLSRGNFAQILSDDTLELDWPLRIEMMIDTARGINYLHNCRPPIVHRDLKTDNLLVDENWQVKVADFGLARSLQTYAKTNCGTIGYAAPEVLQNKPYTEKADVYSFGVVLWEVLTREIPYRGKQTIAVIHSIDKGETLEIPESCPASYAQLMRNCWQQFPENRPTFTEILGDLEIVLEAALKKEGTKIFPSAEESGGESSDKMQEDESHSVRSEEKEQQQKRDYG